MSKRRHMQRGLGFSFIVGVEGLGMKRGEDAWGGGGHGLTAGDGCKCVYPLEKMGTRSRVPNFGLRVSGVGCQVSGVGSRGSDLGCWFSRVEFQVRGSGVGFRVSRVGHWRRAHGRSF